MSTPHTRKTFFAKALAALAGLGILGGARAAAKPSSAPASPAPAAGDAPFTLRADPRAVARSVDTL